ncbi:50S ribosomal protein L31 [Patescibacteria group bacterium]|nr:50S ribosomal protein L31 [Patescibacteria group bacterium]
MKKNIQPKYYKKAQVTCGCGNKFSIGSTRPTISVEICSACHPVFTGKQKFIDTAGRLERFEKIAQKSKKIIEKKKTKKVREKTN